MKRHIVPFLTLLAVWNLAAAAAGEPLELQTRYGHYYTNLTVNLDGTAVESREWSMTVLKETALEWAKRTSISYSTSAQKAEVVAAYTQKPDGRRIEVPKDNYQIELNRGQEKNSPVYSDNTTLTVVFPELGVGDQVVFSYRLVQTEPLFPDHFSVSQYFSRDVAFDDVRVRIDYPAALWAQHDARGMTLRESSEKDGRKAIEWTYANPGPVRNARRDYSVYDPEKETGYAFSTFMNYADIAAAYGARALPKAAVTERVQALADEIVKGRTGPKEQARALYDWVATRITYAGNCIGVGAVVPRDVSFILDNKMGDCKDHATLLQALLAARNIRSTQALVNSGPVYRLAKIPVVSTVNHVINYLPALDLYLDSTSSTTPFGMLPFQVEDKPVILVEGYRDGLKTPVQPAGANQQKLMSRLAIAPDGSVSGTLDVTQKGMGAVQSRAWARVIAKEVEDDLVKNLLRAQSISGSGRLEKDDPAALVDTYHYTMRLDAEKFIKLPGTGAFHIYPLLNLGGSIQNALASSMEPEQEADVACSGGSVTEEYVIELPKTLKVLSIPDNLKIANDFLAYEARYKLDGRVLKVKRTLDDRTKGNVCAPRVFAAYKKLGEQAMDNLKSQVLYKAGAQ